uniref:Uncharacterized protein n=1 Tax=Tanacetum cinerariifolium TaxID=118510 RepID=A0A6L2JTV4_TANCI|nr:hypothetical protein [Tanacetum cinerariifolium]
MTTTAAQQVTLDNALVPPEKQVKIGKCNMRINPAKTQKEPTYQVVLDALAVTTCYPAFLITADVLEIYMHHFWFTINKKDSTSYWFKIDKKRSKIFMHTAQDDTILGPMRFVSKADDYQVYEALLPKVMTNQKMRASPAYKTYLALAIGAAIPKKAQKFKKPASPSKKKNLVIVEEPEPAKKVVPSNNPSRKQSTGVQIQDIHGVSVSKKKAQATTDRSKGIDLFSEAALFEEVHVKKFLKRSRREQLSIKQAAQVMNGDEDAEYQQDNEEDALESDDDLQQDDDERTDSENQMTNDEDKENEDAFVHTLKDYVPTDDETKDVDEEEYERISEELYGYVNVKLTDAEHNDEEKGDADMIDVAHVQVE